MKLLSRNDYIFLFVITAALVTISRYNYVLFHSLVEISIATTGFLTFAFTWHLRRFELGSLLVIGIMLGCTAFMSVFHMLSYKGMHVFGSDSNLPTQLWISARYFFSITLLFASIANKFKINPSWLLTSLCSITVILLAAVFSGNFPDCFVDNGLTEFKFVSEYVISGILIAAMILSWKNRQTNRVHLSRLVLGFFMFSILTELVFTTYLGVYDLSNMMGHMFQLYSYYFLYKAIVETGLEKPFDLLFRNLSDAVKARDEFISMASHELKTPLTPLKLQLQMFQRELQRQNQDPEKSAKILKAAKSSNDQVDRMSSLIDGMLDVSRLSTGKFEVFRERIELSKLIEELSKRHETQVRASKSILSLELSMVEIDADPIRLEQVIANLLLNAVKYAPGSEIVIGLEKTSEMKAKIWVKDTGPGICPDAQDRIFNRYERVNSDSSVAGLGLGLYISRQIIEAHGGTLTLVSEINKGSTFIVVV